MDDKNARFAYIMHKYGIVSGWRSAFGCTANLTGAKCKLTYVGVRLISDSKGVWAHESVGCEVRIDERDCAE